MLGKIFAHVGEDHGGTVESTKHALQLDPLVTSLLIIAIAALIPLALYKFTKSAPAAMVVALGELLLIGILTYSILPALSAVALVAGFTLTLILVFSSM